ncbi:hypothetical protein [Bradyrhizobium sp. RT3a]|uniref:hypothetical protein n=1 Tax=unclassified Bradyrhizobium TaxID=2631580 RepID=UPI003394A105
MSKTLSVVLVLLLATIGHVWADPLTEDMTKLNAQWDAAINDPNFDALLLMYATDASLMPPAQRPSLALLRYATSLPKEARASEITSLSL